MIYCNQLIKRSFDLTGASDIYSDEINGNDFNPIFIKLQDVINSLNNDPQIVFGYTTIENVDCKGYSTVYFKPVTDEETEEGITEFDDNRLFYTIPTIAPTVIINNDEIEQINHSQLIIIRQQTSSPDYFSFYREYDRAVVNFSGPASSPVTFVYQSSISIPTQPTDVLRVPDQFINYIIAQLAVEICVVYSMTETLATISAKMQSERNSVIANNMINRQDVILKIDPRRFERSGYRTWRP